MDFSPRLLERIRDRDPEAVRLFVRHFERPLWAYVVGMVRDAGLAEEICQDALMRAIQGLARLPPDRLATLALEPWLYRIALNLTRNTLRKRRWPIAVGDGRPTAETRTPDADVERREVAEAVWKALGELPVAVRGVVIWFYIEGYSYSEIADRLGKPVGTVKAQISRAAARLRRALDEHRPAVRGGNRA
jgi:RNA polymerase sigma-70 factor (ECF subfamily)